MDDLLRRIGALEGEDGLHEARLLVLLRAFAGKQGHDEVKGLTKLAKLDFLLRYPQLLERALSARNASTKAVQVQEHERQSVESRMVRYRFGPWDHRYRRILNLLIARGLATVRTAGRAIIISLTEKGIETATTLADKPEFEDFARRAKSLKTHLDLSATALMKFIYATVPEIATLRSNAPIQNEDSTAEA